MASEGLQLLGYARVVVLGAMSPGPDFAVQVYETQTSEFATGSGGGRVPLPRESTP
jgi:threonine/homoserine/homoserine lactone efflux protein